MHRKILATGAVCAAALLVWATFDSAEARRSAGFHGGGGVRSFSGGGMRFHGGGGNRGYRHARRGAYLALPFAAYGGYRYYGGGGGCYWLKEKAMYTGSRYWWSRYQACINGY